MFAGGADVPVAGQLMDLSAGGVSFRARVEPTPGAGAFVDFVYKDRWACQATGHVVRVLPFGTAERGVAIEFGFANEALQAFLQTLAETPEALRPDLLEGVSDMSIRVA